MTATTPFDFDAYYEAETANDASNIDYGVKYMVATTEMQLANMQRAKHQIESNKITNVPQCVIIDAVGDGDAKTLNIDTYTLVMESIERSGNKLPASIGITDLTKFHEIIVSNASPIDLAEYLKAYGSNPEQYRKDNQINIPPSITAIIVQDYLVTLCRTLGYRLCKVASGVSGVNNGYIFNGKYWTPYNENFISGLLMDILVKIGYDKAKARTVGTESLLRKSFWNNAPNCPNSSNSKVLINLSNATLEINNKGEVIQGDFKRNEFLQYCLPYEYEPKAKTPIFTKYLNRVLPDIESQIVLQELIGNIFIKNMKLEKLGILYGGGANGKSVFTDIIVALLGENNCCEMSLKAITTDPRADNNRATLAGKLLNFASEMNAKGVLDHDLIKQMASGEAIQVKTLYKDTSMIKNYAKMVFNTNTLPYSKEFTHGYRRRLLIVHFDQTIPEKERDLTLANSIISTELAGVLNWIIEGTKRLQKNRAFSSCRKSELILKNYMNDVIEEFIDHDGYKPDKSKKSSNLMTLKTFSFELAKYLDGSEHTLPADRTIADKLRSLGFEHRCGKPSGFYMLQDGEL